MVLVIALCVAMPGAALAKGNVSFSSIKGKYTVASRANLTVTAWLHVKSSTADLSMHAPVVVQRKVGGKWRDILVVRPGSHGRFKFTLVRPHAGDYRVVYPGCRHYRPRAVHFDVSHGTSTTPLRSSVKLLPLLSVRDVSSMFFISSAKTDRRSLALIRPLWPVSFDIETSQSPEAMTGSNLTFRVSASITGATYTPVYSFPSGFGFGGKSSVYLTAAAPIFDPVSTDFYNYYRVDAVWNGNRFTRSGSASGIASMPVE